MRRWLQQWHWPPTRRELLVGGISGLVAGVVGIVLIENGYTPTLKSQVIQLAVGIPVVVFVRWRWGEAINRWFRS